MYGQQQTYEIVRKDQSPKIHGWHQTVCQKWKIIGNPYSGCENIQSGYKNGI